MRRLGSVCGLLGALLIEDREHGGGSFHTSNDGQIQSGTCNFPAHASATWQKVVDIPLRPSHAARAVGVFACVSTDQRRWAAEVAASRQSVASSAFALDRSSEGVALWKSVCAVQAPVCVGVVPHS